MAAVLILLPVIIQQLRALCTNAYCGIHENNQAHQRMRERKRKGGRERRRDTKTKRERKRIDKRGR